MVNVDHDLVGGRTLTLKNMSSSIGMIIFRIEWKNGGNIYLGKLAPLVRCLTDLINPNKTNIDV